MCRPRFSRVLPSGLSKMSYGKMGNGFPLPPYNAYAGVSSDGGVGWEPWSKCITCQIILGQSYDGCFDSGCLLISPSCSNQPRFLSFSPLCLDGADPAWLQHLKQLCDQTFAGLSTEEQAFLVAEYPLLLRKVCAFFIM